MMQHTQYDISALKPRILLVENDPRTRIAEQALLLHWGYEPTLALGEGEALIRDAKEKAHQMRCSLALIDLRLLDDFDDEDTSGLQLAREISPARPIILSGHGNPKILREILDKNYDIKFISKTDSREIIRQALEDESKKVCAIKRGLVIDPPDAIEKIMQSELGEQTGAYPDQITDAFARIFPNAKRLKIEKFETKSLTSNISTVPRPKSLVLKVHEEDFEPVIVKLARSKKIANESERYYQYVAKRLTGSFTARLEQYAILWDIGGISYSYIGDFDVALFSAYFEEHSLGDIQKCLNSFFKVVWGKHYEKAKVVNDVSLFELYDKVWENWYEKRVKKFKTPSLMEFNQIHGEIAVPDPIAWFKKHIKEQPQQDASRVSSTKIAVTHGDLHADNLMIDSQKNAWVIDFERTGEGHALQDFVELESDLLNRFPHGNDDYRNFYTLWLTAIQPSELASIPVPPGLSDIPEICKVIQTISCLRTLALECTGMTDFRQYLWGLFFNAIFRATIIAEDDAHKKSQVRALMLASLICHRLEHWDKPWPPAEWNATMP